MVDINAGELLDGVPVAESHADDGTPNMGYWYCDNHGPLRNNLEAESHTGKACRLAWFCFTHNRFEAP